MNAPFIIAEIAQGYEGSPKLCEKFVRLAKKSGANAVKFQIFQAAELCRNDYQYNDLFKSLEISPKDWVDIVNLSTELGIDFYADIFGLETLSWMLKTNVKGIKIHGSDIKNYPFLEKVAQFNGTIVLSVGGSELSEIEKALSYFKKNHVVLMSGFQGEPNYPGDVELNKIEVLRNKFNRDIGYADHIDASDSSLALTLPAIAFVKGANYIEKHLTFERVELQLEDSVSALNPDEFKVMVNLLQSVSSFNQTTEYVLTPREQEYRKNTKKVPLINKRVEAGHIVKHEDIEFLRIGTEKPALLLDYDQIIGKTLLKGLNAQEILLAEILK